MVGTLGSLLAVEYVRDDADGETAIFRHVFGTTDEPIAENAESRPVLGYNNEGLRISGGAYDVSKERGIMEQIETISNPRKTKAEKTEAALKSARAKLRELNPKKKAKKAKKKKSSKKAKVDVKGMLAPVFGGILAVAIMKLSAKMMDKAKAGGTNIPDVLTANPSIAPALLGILVLATQKKVGIRNIGLSMVVVAAAVWFARFANTNETVSGFLGDSQLEGLANLAPRMTPRYAARRLGLTSARPRISAPGRAPALMSQRRGSPGERAGGIIDPSFGIEGLTYGDAPQDPTVDTLLGGDVRGIGALEPGGLPSWSDRGTFEGLATYYGSSYDDPEADQFGDLETY